jgi:pimeloyl-ACP methyl ester carboxylesterase
VRLSELALDVFNVICYIGTGAVVNFNYVVMPIVICVAGVFVVWLSSRRMLALPTRRYQSRRMWIERILLAIVILVTSGIAGYTAFNAITVHLFWLRNPPPGRLVDVDGYKMHIDCTGTGSPTLILESGGQNDSTIWNGVQPALSTTTKVCSYDRAGFGWSDTRPTPRDADHIAAELHQLLLRAGVVGPVVLMGHSIGGLYIRDYVMHYPADVADIVFLDSSTPFQDWNPAFIRAGGKPNTGPPAWLWNVALIVGVPRLLGICRGGHGPDAALDKLRAEEFCRLRTASFAEIENFDSSSRETVDSRSFGAIPILIISHDPARSLPAKPTQTDLDRQNAWGQMQDELKNLSTRSRRIIAKNGSHQIALDRPDLIEKEVPAFIEQIRGTLPQPAAYGSTLTE